MLETLYRLERIEQVDATHVAAVVMLDSGHAIYAGHFPGRPVLPGVCMLRIVHDTLASALQQRLRLIHARSIKFLAVVDPRIQETLLVDAVIILRDGPTVEVKATLSDAERAVMRFHGVFADASTIQVNAP